MSRRDLGPLTGALPAEIVSANGERQRWTVGGAVPEAVVSPSSVEEVRSTLVGARGAGVGVVPLGGGTDPGCEAPEGPFIVLSTRSLTGVEAYEPADLTVTARAGLVLADLDAELSRHGQWLPVDPPLAPRRTFGGLVATGAAGPLGTAYGAPRDHVLGVHVVTGDGRELHLGGRVMKNVAGFDLVKLMVGSRGTLGVVISATVRLFPRPAVDRVLVLEGDSPGALLADARALATAPLVPASAVLSLSGPDGRGAALVIRLQGALPAVDAEELSIRRLLSGAPRCVDGAEGSALLERIRDRACGGVLGLRAAALPAALPAVMDAVSGALPAAELSGDVLTGRVRASTAEDDVAPEALVTLRRRMAELGGTLVLTRAPAAVVERAGAYRSPGDPEPAAVRLASRLKRRFDPERTLSPGRFVR